MKKKECRLSFESVSLTKTLFCPSCGADLTDFVCNLMQQMTGMSAETFRNGEGLRELSVKLQIAELTLSKAGIKIDQDAIAKEVIEWVNRILSERLSEEEKQHYQENIDAIEEELTKDREHYTEQINLLKDTLKDEISKKQDLQKQLDQIQAEQKFVPSLKGGITEEDLARRIRSVAPYDELSLKQRHQGSTDILAKAKLCSDKEIIVGKICIESKDVEKWKDEFIQEAKDHGRKEGTENIILATTAMPRDAINSNLDCFRDGVWIVPLNALEFVYASYRRILVEQYNVQKKFESQMEAMNEKKKIADQLKDIVTTETFKKYSETARDLLKQADNLDEESRTMTNYIQSKSSRFERVACAIRSLVNCMVEHSDEIQKKIKEVLVPDAK